MKRNRLRFGIFIKMSVAFILVGLFPLLLISIFSLREFKENVSGIMLNNAESSLELAVNSVDSMLIQWKTDSEEMYTRPVERGVWLSDVISDVSLPGEEKSRKIRIFLAGFDTSDSLKSVRFIDREENLYYLSDTVGKVANAANMETWKAEELKGGEHSHKMMIGKVHEDDYFSNENDDVITVKRELYDAGSLKNVENRLGTLYMDISVEWIEEKLGNLEFGEQSGFYILDHSGNVIYKSGNQEVLTGELVSGLVKEASRGGFMETGTHYYLCRENGEAGWVSVVNIHKEDVLQAERKMERYIVTVVLGSSVFLIILYFLFSRAFSRPIHELKRGMEQIEEGKLDTRVSVMTRDELGVLAEGLNHMTEQLSIYIARVYGAELKQREAQVRALKSQINPHYLYNTLDVIRMTAMENQDYKTAEMIESLARQLRYMTRSEQDVVTLKEELDNISDYFMLLRIRYEEKMALNVSVAQELLDAPILKLILQPIVENGVKHGLKKKGSGKIWISADLADGMLEITVMDNGVGIGRERLEQLQGWLKAHKEYIETAEDKGVGLVNIEERIRGKYGNPYGLNIESTEGKGTIVIVRLPFMRDRQDK